MKKFLTLSALLASIAFAGIAAEAKTNSTATALTANESAPQIRVQIGPNRRRNVRVVNRTRVVRRGYATYRETWQYRYFPNGRVVTRLVSRVRILR